MSTHSSKFKATQAADQILSTEAAYEFCSNQIRNVNFFLISKEALQHV